METLQDIFPDIKWEDYKNCNCAYSVIKYCEPNNPAKHNPTCPMAIPEISLPQPAQTKVANFINQPTLF